MVGRVALGIHSMRIGHSREDEQEPTFSHSRSSSSSDAFPHPKHASGASTSKGCLGRSDNSSLGRAMNSVVCCPAATLEIICKAKEIGRRG